MWPNSLVLKLDQSSEPPGGTPKMKSPTQDQGLRIPQHRAQNLYHQKAPYDSNARRKLGTAGLQYANSVKVNVFCNVVSYGL